MQLSELASLLICPSCSQPMDLTSADHWKCPSCGFQAPLRDGKPFFTSIPEAIQPFEKIERGPEKGTPWRQANWKFLEKQVSELDGQALILDVGAGHGDFADIFQNRRYLSLDVVPYAEVDMVCDLTRRIPFRPGTFDMLVLMNVLEHVFEPEKLLNALSILLKPGGKLLVAVPFMIKVHQPPYDFYRYTHFALPRMGQQAGLELVELEGYYDPVFFLGEGTRNVQHWVLPRLSQPRRLAARAALLLNQLSLKLFSSLIGKGSTAAPDQANNPAAIGYQLIFTRPTA